MLGSRQGARPVGERDLLPEVVAQVDGDSVGCRILVDGQVRDEHSVSHEGAAVACTVTAA